jgi:hypothetical protein
MSTMMTISPTKRPIMFCTSPPLSARLSARAHLYPCLRPHKQVPFDREALIPTSLGQYLRQYRPFLVSFTDLFWVVEASVAVPKDALAYRLAGDTICCGCIKMICTILYSSTHRAAQFMKALP